MGCIISHSAKQDRTISPTQSITDSSNGSSNNTNNTGPYSRSSYRFVHKEVTEKVLNQNINNNIQGIVGLKNLGNTCFMNSALQCLSNTVPLVDYFLGYSWSNELNKKNPVGTGGVVAEQFGNLISKMWSGKKAGKSISPTEFKKAISSFRSQFRGNNQHDSHEFLAFLLDGLHEDLNRVLNKPYVPEIDSDGKLQEDVAVEAWKAYLLRNRSVIVDIFQGQLRNILSCLACGYQSFTFDPFMYMTVPISKAERKSLHDCLAEFCRPEILSLDSQWKCPKCKLPRDAEKKMDIWIAPPIFIVHLKRFENNQQGRRYKLDTAIDFPISNLDLSEFMGSNQPGQHIYDLYGCINHIGSLGQGHYTSYAKNRMNNKWYSFNDSSVREIQETEVCTKSAYVLFYNKVFIPENDINDASSSSVIISGGMIKRQSISGPHYWPHVNDPASPDRTSTIDNPHFDIIRLALSAAVTNSTNNDIPTNSVIDERNISLTSSINPSTLPTNSSILLPTGISTKNLSVGFDEIPHEN